MNIFREPRDIFRVCLIIDIILVTGNDIPFGCGQYWGDNISSIFQNGHIFNFRDFNHINSLALSAKLKILIFENIS